MYLSNSIAQSNCIATTKRQKVLKVCDPVPLLTGNYLDSSFFLWQSQQSVKEASDNGRSSVWRRITLSKLGQISESQVQTYFRITEIYFLCDQALVVQK